MLFEIIIADTTTQKTPAKETVVNFGVSFLHLKETEKIENPNNTVALIYNIDLGKKAKISKIFFHL